MRLAIVTESFPPRINGVSRTVAELTAYLRRNRHEALIFTPGGGLHEHDGFEVVGVRGVRGWLYPDLTVSPVAPGMRRRLREFAPHVVHLASPAALGVWGGWTAWSLDLPVAAHYQTDLLGYARAYGGAALALVAGIAARSFHNRCTATYAPTPPMAEELCRRGFERVRVSGRGVDAGLFRPHRQGALQAARHWPPGDGARVLSVSRLAREKNLVSVLDIAAKHPELRFLLVGDGPMGEELSQRAPPNLNLAGALRGPALADCYAAADVFLHPSVTETFGQVVQEAMASGLPVAGIRSGGVGWLVEHGVTGVLVDPPGHDLGDALGELVHRYDRRAMGEAAHHAVSGRTWSAVFDALLADYTALAAGGNLTAA